MSSVLVSITVFFHLLLPLILPIWIFRSKAGNKLQWLSIVVLAASYLWWLGVAGAGWHWFGYYLPYLFGLFLLTMFGFALTKRLNLPWLPQKKSLWIGISSRLIILSILLMAIPIFYSAKQFPENEAIELVFPLREGNFYIVHGGNDQSMNHHHIVEEQRFALDIVKLNNFGLRAAGFLPKDLKLYATHHIDVIAPCSGKILSVINDLPDLIPPNMDAKNPRGNHVAIACNESKAIVHLAHLAQGSILVAADDSIVAGAFIGKVGNSGNTSEPHLHVHASYLLPDGKSSKGIPMKFLGKFLVRGDRFLL